MTKKEGHQNFLERNWTSFRELNKFSGEIVKILLMVKTKISSSEILEDESKIFWDNFEFFLQNVDFLQEKIFGICSAQGLCKSPCTSLGLHVSLPNRFSIGRPGIKYMYNFVLDYCPTCV